MVFKCMCNNISIEREEEEKKTPTKQQQQQQRLRYLEKDLKMVKVSLFHSVNEAFLGTL